MNFTGESVALVAVVAAGHALIVASVWNLVPAVRDSRIIPALGYVAVMVATFAVLYFPAGGLVHEATQTLA